jgi:hypothetical protein
MVVKPAIAGMLAFDVDQPLSGPQAAEFVLAGYSGCIRYFPLNSSDVPGCLTALELQVLISAGLAVAGVQHVDSPPWSPTAALGSAHGQYAVAHAKTIGYPAGGPIYCDLEEVAAGTTAQQVIDYCTNWYNEITNAGFFAGLYCGWNIVLTAKQLYDLPYKSYWKSYNYDNGVATRGFQLIQKTQQTIHGILYDPDIAQTDELGDLPIFVFLS